MKDDDLPLFAFQCDDCKEISELVLRYACEHHDKLRSLLWRAIELVAEEQEEVVFDIDPKDKRS